MIRRLSATFLAAVGSPTLRADLERCADLEEQLATLVRDGQQAWPELATPPEEFVEHLGTVAACDSAQAWLGRLRAADLWLACACARGDSGAIEAFELQHAKDLDKVVDRFAKSGAHADDLRQSLRDKLFVGGPKRRPKIATYGGVGFLENWLRVTAVRTFIDVARGDRDVAAQAPLDLAYADGNDFEIDFLKQHYAAEFKRVFAEAIAELEPAARNLLRYKVRGLNINQIATLEGVHRATAARRVASIRAAVLAGTRRRLGSKLAVDPNELDSIMQLVQSRLDVSLERLLKTDGPAL